MVTLTISPGGRRTACLSYVAAEAPDYQPLKIIHENREQGDQAQQSANPSDASDEEVKGAEVEPSSPEGSIESPDRREEEKEKKKQALPEVISVSSDEEREGAEGNPSSPEEVRRIGSPDRREKEEDKQALPEVICKYLFPH